MSFVKTDAAMYVLKGKGMVLAIECHRLISIFHFPPLSLCLSLSLSVSLRLSPSLSVSLTLSPSHPLTLSADRLRCFAVEGICYGISTGSHTITMLSGECSSDYNTGLGHVGSQSNSWLFIQEVDTDADSGACPMLQNSKAYRDHSNEYSGFICSL